MSQVNLNPDTLSKLKALVENPSNALHDALEALAPNGKWDLLTQKVGSSLAKTDQVEFTLPLLDKSLATDGALNNDWSWKASANSNAALSMDLLTGQDLEHLTVRPDDGHTMIVYGARISAGGQLGADTANLPWGSIGIDGQGQRAMDIDWYVQASNTDTLVATLAAAQTHFNWPHDIQSMLRQAKRTDWFGMEYTIDGSAQFAIDVDASESLTGWTFDLGGQAASVGLSFGVKAGVKASRQSKWKLSAFVETREKAAGLRIKLHDLKQSSRTASLDITAGADFAPVAASAEKALRAAWPDAGQNALLDALTMPGSAITDRLRGLIEEDLEGSLSPLATLLVGGKPSKDLRNTLVNKFTFGLADALDNALGDIAGGTADASKLGADWLSRMFGSAADKFKLDDKLQLLLAKAINSATSGLTGAITKLKDQITGEAQAEVDAVLKSLGELGAQFQQAMGKLDDNAASTAIRNALQSYSGLRKRFLAVLADGQKQKLALQLSASFSSDLSSEAAFDVWFRADDTITPEAERLFNMVCGGYLLALPDLVRAAASKGAVSDAKGWLLSSAEKLSAQRMGLNFFGIQFGSSTSWLKDVSVQTDLVTGNLLAASAKSSVETGIANPWKDRTARLGVQLEITDGGRGAGRLLAASLNGAFTAKQENTNRDKVQDLLNAYADATGAQRGDIGLFLDIPPDADSTGARSFWKGLTLAIPVALDAQCWTHFATQDASTISQTSLEYGLAAFQRRYLPDSTFSKDPVADLRNAAEEAGEASILAFLKRFPRHYVGINDVADEANALNIDATSDPMDRGCRQFLAFHRLSATVQAPLRLRDLIANIGVGLQTLATPVDPDAMRKLLDPALSQVQAILAPVALVSETWLGIGLGGAKDEPVAWPFVSFISSMAKLGGLDVPPGFVPVAQSGSSPPVTLIPRAR